MYNIKDRYSEIRISTVNKIVNEWKYYEDFIVDLSMTVSSEDYKNLPSRDGKYGEVSN